MTTRNSVTVFPGEVRVAFTINNVEHLRSLAQVERMFRVDTLTKYNRARRRIEVLKDATVT